MAKPTITPKETVATIDQNLEQFRVHLARLKNFLMGRETDSSIDDFDLATEELIAKVFGNASMMVEAYAYAQMGEAGGLLNLTNEGSQGVTLDLERDCLLQRQRVLESCIAELEARRAELSREGRVKKISGPRVADFMTRQVKSLSGDATLKEAATLFKEAKIGSALIEGEDGFVGSITETELTREVVANGLDPATTPVKTCMREPLVTVESSDPIVEAVKLMKEKGTRHLAVIENGEVIGVISVSDVLRYYSGVS